MKTAKRSLFIVFCSMMLVYGCVSTDELSILNGRIDTLEKRLESQQAQLLAGEEKTLKLESRADKLSGQEEGYRSQFAEIQAGMDQMRMDIQSLRGKVEEAQHAMEQQQSSVQATGGEQAGRLDRLEGVSQKTEDRLRRIEQYLNLESARSVPAAPIAEPQSPKALTQDQRYHLAKQAFDNGSYENAREKFGDFLKRYPKSENADNAQFWIGETYYREKWYEKAILEYQKAIETYPKGNKVPASLLKQGLAFLNLGDKSNSRLILKELVKKYPKSNEARVALQKLKDIR